MFFSITGWIWQNILIRLFISSADSLINAFGYLNSKPSGKQCINIIKINYIILHACRSGLVLLDLSLGRDWTVATIKSLNYFVLTSNDLTWLRFLGSGLSDLHSYFAMRSFSSILRQAWNLNHNWKITSTIPYFEYKIQQVNFYFLLC